MWSTAQSPSPGQQWDRDIDLAFGESFWEAKEQRPYNCRKEFYHFAVTKTSWPVLARLLLGIFYTQKTSRDVLICPGRVTMC
jgi:hypothetical protein